MAKRELFAMPIVGFVLRATGNFLVRRCESDRRALETALRVLEAGQPLGFFPQGHAAATACCTARGRGSRFLARRSGAPLVPVAISGTPEARLRMPPRTEIVVRPSFTVGDLGGGLHDQALADAIFSRVAELLPSRIRGVYAERIRP